MTENELTLTEVLIG